jgi:4-alpha-glucanotransferase
LLGENGVLDDIIGLMLFVNFTFHFHQPVGNFDFVVDRAFEDAYGPLIHALLERPEFRCTLHVSGSLFDHLSGKHPEFTDNLKELCSRGQVEMLASGYYEPILTEIPYCDALKQVEQMRHHIQDNFGQATTGFWCTERIYDQNLPGIAQESGLKYTLLDDYLILRNLDEEQLYRHMVVNEGDHELTVFPISEKLRYLVPFHPVSHLAAHLQDLDRRYQNLGIKAPITVFGDDGEKFGVWPGTKQWVYDSGWISDFFNFFERNSEQFPLVHLSEFCAVHPPSGIATLSAGSYREMCEWVLPVHKQRDLARARRILANNGVERPENILLAGNFKYFHRKYEETRRLLFKNRYLSHLVDEAECAAVGEREKAIADQARKHVMQAQCNCAYWHGVFGGLYLNYLREALNEQMIFAEKDALDILNPKLPTTQLLDYYEDRREEALVRNEFFTLLISPHRGLAVDWCDYRPATMALLNGMGRYYEYYHDKLFAANQQQGQDQHASIHEAVRLKDGHSLSDAAFDSYPRLNFVDLFLPGHPGIEALVKGDTGGALKLWELPYSCEMALDSIHGRAETSIGLIEKKITWENNRITVSYALKPISTGIDGTFVSELNLNLLTDQGGRWAEHNGAKLALSSAWETTELAGGLSFVDDYRKVRITLQAEGVSSIGFYPVRTLAMSEGGAELLYQAQAVAIFREIHGNEPVQFELSLTVIPL